jgi:hypothetical protein
MAEPIENRAPPDRAPEERLQTILGWGLRIGTLAVAAGMAVALVWSLATGAIPSLQSAPLWPRASFDPGALVLLTALLLVLLPPARVILAAVAFARERDWLYCAFSAVALALIATSTFLGLWLRKG